MPTYSGVTVDQLESLTSPENDDLLIINDVSSGNTKKITRENFLFNSATDILARNIRDSSTGVVISGPSFIDGDTTINGDLQIENEITAGGDISTTGNISFGSLTDYINDITVLRFVDSANGIINFDSGVPTNLAVRDYVSSNKAYSRTSSSATTVAMVQNDSVYINISGYKSYALLKVATDSAAWVRIYCDSASRAADIGRAYGTRASDSSGLLAEINTTGPDTITLSPGIIGYNNSTPIIGVIPIKVSKRTASPAASGITVTLTALKLED